MHINSFKLQKMHALSIVVIFFSSLFPFIVYSACGPIPATYPLYSDSKLKLEKDILVNGNNVSKGEYKPKAAIDINGTVTTNVTLSFPTLDPSIFPSNNSNADLKIKNSTTINHSAEVFYDELKIDKKNITVNFTGGGPFHIDKLEVKKENVTLNFAAGTYYIDEFKIDDKNVTLNISSSPVIFHIGNKFKIDDKDANINTGGNVDDFRVYLHSGAEFKSEKENLNFTGLIYGPNNVDKVEIEGKNSSFHGAIIVSGGDIEVKDKNVSFTYTTADQTAIGNISTCITTISKLIASYNFDDDWVTNNLLADQTGNFNGNPSGSISRVQSGPSGLKGDTCSAASFTGGKIGITGLPVSTSTGAKTSISFWMYWDGTKNVMPLGWYRHNLFFGANNSGRGSTIYFGFNTWGWDVTGISSSGLSNGWHHVAAVFTNGNVANNQIYIDGTLQSISHRTGRVFNSNAYVQSTLVLGATGASSSWPFSGKIDNLKVYNGTITQAQVSADMSESNSCSGGGSGDTPATAFNCVENGTNGVSGKLYTKTITQNFSFDVIALKNTSAIETSFASGVDHTVTVELVNAISGTCTTFPSINSQNLLFTSSDTGTKTSASMSSSTAYSKVKCRVTDATDSPTIVGCSTDSFTIRPTNLTITSTDLINTNSPTESLTPTTIAGTNFNLTATATPGYTGTPSINNTILQSHSEAITTGTIAESFDPAVSGTGSASGDFSYPEVGWFRFPVQGVFDDSYTELAQDEQNGDCIINSLIENENFSDTPNADGKIGCKFGNKVISNYFGRFTPDHFEITATQNGNFSDTCTGFSYSGQSVGYSTNPTLTVTAYNAIGGITQNYRQSYAKLDPVTDFNVTAPTTDASQLGVDTINKVNLTWTPGTSSFTDNLNGSLTFAFGNDSFNYQHEANSLITPFTAAVDLIFTAITDSDGITTQGLPQTLQPSGTPIRFGRLNIDNAHGSELSPLPVPIYTEYFNGTFFIAATDDSCTTINLADLRFNGAVTPSLGATTVSAGLNFTAPGTGHTGYIDITTDLFITSFPWLSFDWDGNNTYDVSVDNSPKARASFGIYKGNSNQIYFREVY